MLTEARRLWTLGLAILWLHPKSKRPIDTGWTTGPRHSGKRLRDQYRDGFNIGVRLGTPSKVGGKYLAAIDCDVKSTDPRHKAEMEKKLAELFPGLNERSPRSQTGRGNGSCHVFILTEKAAGPRRLSQSSEKVKVKMPSAKASKGDAANLSPAELAAGWRMRTAWEIALMGTGQQVVLPPSIHPDTSKPYVWVFGLEDPSQLSTIDVDTVGSGSGGVQKSSTEPAGSDKFKFQTEDIDLLSSSVPDPLIDMWLTGKECSDRSAGLLIVAEALVKASERFTVNQMLTALTDKDSYLGQAPYVHARTQDRNKAAYWVYRYTLKRAIRDYDISISFGVIDARALKEIGETLTDDEAKTQVNELCPTDVVEFNDEGKPYSSLKNVISMFCRSYGRTIFRFNEFSGLETHGVNTAWAKKDEEITDAHLAQIVHWFSKSYRIEPAVDKILKAITVISRRNTFHPPREYLRRLVWDGVPRIDTWLKDYMGAVGPEPYISDVSRKTLVALVKRVFFPGCKYDQVLILEGKQGIGKSTALRNLVGDEWFSDAHVNIADKDGVLAIKSAWLVELGELSGMRQADADLLKEFISRRTDKIRVPYGRRPEAFPRQCIFIGTTNSAAYLKDLTGNRRYWPVTVTKVLYNEIEKVASQLLAEAVYWCDLDEPLYLRNKANDQAAAEQEARLEEDAWVHLIGDFLQRQKESPTENFPVDRFSLNDIFSDWGPLPKSPDHPQNQKRVSAALRKLGYDNKPVKIDGVPKRLWVLKR